jgi:hypothetical protein
VENHLSPGIKSGICAALVTRFDSRKITVRVVRKHLESAQIEVWGCMRQIDSEEGETIYASCVGGKAEDGRDTTFVHVILKS